MFLSTAVTASECSYRSAISLVCFQKQIQPASHQNGMLFMNTYNGGHFRMSQQQKPLLLSFFGCLKWEWVILFTTFTQYHALHIPPIPPPRPPLCLPSFSFPPPLHLWFRTEDREFAPRLKTAENANIQPNPGLILRAEPTVTNILKVTWSNLYKAF